MEWIEPELGVYHLRWKGDERLHDNAAVGLPGRNEHTWRCVAYAPVVEKRSLPLSNRQPLPENGSGTETLTQSLATLKSYSQRGSERSQRGSERSQRASQRSQRGLELAE